MTTDMDLPQDASTESSPVVDDAEILARLRRHDRETQTCVQLTHRPSLMAIAHAILDNRASAAHVVADVFTDFFFHHVDGIRKEESVPAYLRMMTIRRARQPAHGMDPCLRGLGDKPRQLLKLHVGHELSFGEIGERLGLSPRAAGKITMKALKRIRQCADRLGVPVSDGNA